MFVFSEDTSVFLNSQQNDLHRNGNSYDYLQLGNSFTSRFNSRMV